MAFKDHLNFYKVFLYSSWDTEKILFTSKIMLIAITKRTDHTETSQFILFVLIFYVPVNKFSVMWVQVFLGGASTKQGITFLTQGHNTVPDVRLESATPPSLVKHFTTEPLHSYMVNMNQFLYKS